MIGMSQSSALSVPRISRPRPQTSWIETVGRPCRPGPEPVAANWHDRARCLGFRVEEAARQRVVPTVRAC